MKNSKWLLAMGCVCIALSAAVGCDSGTEVELNLVQESVELELFEEHDLEYTATEGATLIWSVADSSIVTVVNGKLVALKEGETTVTLQSGKVSDVCTIKVNGLNTALLNVSAEQSQVALYAGETYTLAPTVTYGTKTLEEADFSYESSDPTVVSVSESGVVTATAVGQASVFVTATVFEKSVGCIVNVTVEKSGKITLDTMQSELYALAEYEGTTYKNSVQLQATVTEKGVQKNDATVVWTSSDESVATVENGNVVAVALGDVQITATYVGEDGNSVEAVSFVTVLPVAYTATTISHVIKTERFSVDGLNMDGAEVYVTDGTLKIEVPVVGDALDFSGVDVLGSTTLVINTGNVLLNMPIYIWTGTLSNLEDFKTLRTLTSGHYRLETDFDLTNVAWSYETPVVFNGVLDGGNHTITNFAPAGCGLFYELGGNSAVQNLKFKNATITSAHRAIGCIAAIVSSDASVTVENVTGNILNNGVDCGGLFGRVGGNAEVTLKNNELHIYAENTTTASGALVGCADSEIVMSNDEPSTIYANINLCGRTAYSGYSNSASTAINQNTYVKPTACSEVLDKWDELAGTKIAISETDVVKATFFGKTIEELAFDNGIVLPAAQVEGFEGNNYEIMLEKADGTIAYYAVKIEYGELKLTNANKNLLKEVNSGTIVLQEDIDLSGETWVSKITFTGTLDGNGHAIKNLTTSVNSTANGYQGLFQNLGEGAIIKNVAFVNVTMGANSGVVAGQVAGSSKAKVENVFIQVVKTGNSSTSARYGIVERTNNGSLDLTNVVLKMPGVSQNETLLGHNTKARCTLNNVYGISISPTGNKIAVGTSVVPAQHGCGFFADVAAFNAAEKTLTDFLTSCVETYLNK